MSSILEGKQRHRHVFNSLQAQLRGHWAEIARLLDKHPQVFATKFNPNDDKHQPTAIELLDVLALGRPTQAVNAIAMMTDRIAVEQEVTDLDPRELVRRCPEMLAMCGETIRETATGIADGHLSNDERARIAESIHQLVPLLLGIAAAARS